MEDPLYKVRVSATTPTSDSYTPLKVRRREFWAPWSIDRMSGPNFNPNAWFVGNHKIIWYD